MATTDYGAIDLLTEGQEDKEVSANEALNYLSHMAAGVNSKSVAGAANVTLTAAEGRHKIQVYTGILTGNINVVVPTEGRALWVKNATSGAFTLTVKTAAGTGATVTQGKWALCVCDGVNVEKVYEQP